MKKIWKENAKLILAIFVTVVIASGATYAATTMYDSNTVGYDNTTSGLRSTTVQSALDELYGNVAEVILNIKNLIGNSTLTTTNQTLTGAVNELDDQIGNYKTLNNVTSLQTIIDAVPNYYDIVLANGATSLSSLVGLSSGIVQCMFTRVISSTENRIDFQCSKQNGDISTGKTDLNNNNTITYHVIDTDTINTIGTYEQLGSFNYTGENIQLTKPYTNFRFIYVMCGYYNGYLPSDGSFFAPTAFAESWFERIYFWTTGGTAAFRLHSDNYINIYSKGTSNYMNVYGIK